jgi:hypothetical protein
MTSPDIGGSWVFLGTSLTSALCADDCAYHCAYCVQSGAYYSCSRSVVLALP